MRKEDKGVIIGQIADTVKQYGHFYLVDTTAMDAASTSDLRRKCFKAGIKLVVVKNSLLHKALMSFEDVDFSPLFDSLKGTTSVMFCETANVPAKLLKEFKDGVPTLKLSQTLWLCCSLRRRTLSLLFNQVVTPFTEFFRLWANVQNNAHSSLRTYLKNNFLYFSNSNKQLNTYKNGRFESFCRTIS